jgi:phospholipase/lecithinase/hemolysin
MMRAVKLFALSVVLAVASLPVLGAQQPVFGGFYGFGDSLADNGNVFLATQQAGFNPAIPPSVDPHQTYFAGRFSNGPVAFEYLVQLLSNGTASLRPYLAAPDLASTNTVNFAFGGSGTGFINASPGGFPVVGLRGQVVLFAGGLGGRAPSPNAVYGIISGANDYLGNQPLDPSEVVGNIGDAIQSLYVLGARKVIVLNLPDLGKIPLTINSPQSALLSQLSATHNKLLAKKLKQLANSLRQLDLIAVDVNAVLQQIPPGVDPFTPALAALVSPAAAVCLFVDPSSCPNAPAAAFNNLTLPYVFWDAEHPTTGVHFALAQHLFARLTE